MIPLSDRTKRKKTKVIPSKIGTWNVHTLVRQTTAFVGKELGRYGIEIAALSETRFAEVVEIKEVGAGYTFFWSGRKNEERLEAGVNKNLLESSQDCQTASMTA